MLLIPSFLGPSKIDGAGTGLFAGCAISKGDVVWQFDERIDWLMSSAAVELLPQLTRESVYHYGCQIQDNLWLLSGDNARFVNHSDPGVIASDLIGHANAREIALQDIEFGDEITEDYGRISLDFQRRGFFGGSL